MTRYRNIRMNLNYSLVRFRQLNCSRTPVEVLLQPQMYELHATLIATYVDQ